MGVFDLYLYAAGAASALVLLVDVLRMRPRDLPEPYVRYREHLHPAVVRAELEVRQEYRELAPLYETPTRFGPPAR
ncbi:hypothetical protein OG571_47645 (plasmid) [Streptomyces sp. NBC_01369]|uniref:hypothetical protein n=1 Tax=Streptomyces sp. NBC_01369 TaxID=2903842 RepID=UPI002F9132E3